MKFFFPDSQDTVDPSFDFVKETRAEFRIRQRDDLYAHEIFEIPPFDGILISKAIVDGVGGSSAAKYTLAQRHRLLRLGIRDFLRLDDRPGSARLQTMGDCGAFSYKDEEYPPYSVDDVLEFYSVCGFDLGVSVDHAILAYSQEFDADRETVPEEYRRRQEITLELADEFLRAHRVQGCGFLPVGVAQGWSPASYAYAVERLQQMGYTYIALGGMVPLKTAEILATLARIDTVRRPDTRLHLLGVTRCEHVEAFQRHGVASFDSTSPFLRSFKDGRENYHTAGRNYTAVRVPQVEGNSGLKRQISAGIIAQEHARRLEELCMRRLREYDQHRVPVDAVLEPLREYELLYDGKADRTRAYREILDARPWRSCACDICRSLGIEVIIFRGTERNKRRGFHNLTVFYQTLHREIGASRGRAPVTS